MGLKKQIIQFKDGKEIATYNSATEAANAIESTKSNISKCCLGILKQVKGFTFKYSGDFTNRQKNGRIDRSGGYGALCCFCDEMWRQDGFCFT